MGTLSNEDPTSVANKEIGGIQKSLLTLANLLAWVPGACKLGSCEHGKGLSGSEIYGAQGDTLQGMGSMLSA